MSHRSCPRRGLEFRLRTAAALLLCFALASCQYLQNEFFNLDRARPTPESEESHPPW